MTYSIFMTDFGEVRISPEEMETYSRLDRLVRDVRSSWFPVSSDIALYAKEAERRVEAFKRECEQVARWKFERADDQ